MKGEDIIQGKRLFQICTFKRIKILFEEMVIQCPPNLYGKANKAIPKIV